MALTYTSFLTPASFAAAATRSVPRRMTPSNVWPPDSRMTATVWMTFSTPDIASESPSPLRTSASTVSTRFGSSARRCPRASTRTPLPPSVRRATTRLPIKPLPPVTRIILAPHFVTPSGFLQLVGQQLVVGHSRLQHLSESILRSALQTRRARQVFRRQVVEEIGEPAVRQLKGRLRLFQGPEVRRLHPRWLGKGYGLCDEAAVVEVDVVGGALQQPLERIALFVLLLEQLRRRPAYRLHQHAVRPPQAAQEL